MSKSAEKLYLTQPAISQTIKDIEMKFGVKLFLRKGHKLYLTQEGKELYVYTKRVINSIEMARLCLENLNILNKGVINLGASSTIGNYVLPEFIKNFKEKYPKIRINLFIGNTCQVINKLKLCDIGFGLIEGLPDVDDKEIVIKKFMKDEIIFFCSPQHPFASEKETDMEKLKNEGLIFREEGSGTRQIIEKHLEKVGVSVPIKCEFNTSESIKNAVINNLGVSALSKWIVKRELELGILKQVKIKGLKIFRWFYLLEIKNYNKAQEIFIKYIMPSSGCSKD